MHIVMTFSNAILSEIINSTCHIPIMNFKINNYYSNIVLKYIEFI